MLKMILPVSTADAVQQCAADETLVFKGGGSDVMDRYHGGYLAPTGVVQLKKLPGLQGIKRDGNLFTVGAMTTLDEVANHAELASNFPVLHLSTDHTATPQIRNLATVGGALCQRPRCVYLRNPEFDCKKKGGTTCFAMVGDNAAHAIFDNDVCVAVHPSTLGAALLALDAVLEVRFPGKDAVTSVGMAQFFTFDLSDATRENSLPHGALIEAVRIPVSTRPVKQAYERASPRLLADWAAVEVCVNLAMNGNLVADSRVVLGAVGRTPRRAKAVEEALNGKSLTAGLLHTAAQHASDGADALSFNGYKLQLARNTTEAALLKVLS